jgi:hypothetical protein
VVDETRDASAETLRDGLQLSPLLDPVPRGVPQQLGVTETGDFLVQQLLHDRSFG